MLLKNFDFFSIKYLHLGSFLYSSRDILILVPKTATIYSVRFQQKLNCSSLERFQELKQKLKYQLNVHDIDSKYVKKFHFGRYLRKFIVCSIFGENVLNESIALVAVFGTNIEMSPDESKQLPKWRYLMEKKFKIFQKQKRFYIGQINSSKSCFVLCQLLSWSE